MTPEQIAALFAQAPVIFALLYLIKFESDTHREAVKYYREERRIYQTFIFSLIEKLYGIKPPSTKNEDKDD